MARGKFNKRAGGPRLDVENAAEIEIRNNRLAEYEDVRAQRRAQEDDDGEGEEDDNKDKNKKGKEKKKDKQQQQQKQKQQQPHPMVDTAQGDNIHSSEQQVNGNDNEYAYNNDDDDDGDYNNNNDNEEKKVSFGGDTTIAMESTPASAKVKAKRGNEPPPVITTEADHKRNMAKLAEVRKRREEAEMKRKLEEEMIKQQEELERAKIASITGDGTFDDTHETIKSNKKSSSSSNKKSTPKIPKLDKIAIKKMKPAQLKEALKERELDIQGTAKELMDRLLKYESER
jgi:hypothetical protein